MRIKFAISLLYTLFAGLSVHTQTIIPGGYVSGTWDASGGPYWVQGAVKVHEDSSLHILAGVSINFNDTAYLEIYGQFTAIGEDLNKIIFRGLGSGYYWGGIRIFGEDGASGDSIMFQNCHISNGYVADSLPGGGAIYIRDRDKIVIQDCVLEFCTAENNGGILYLDRSDILIRRNSFLNSAAGSPGMSSKGGAIYCYMSHPTILESMFMGNSAAIGAVIFTSASSMEIQHCEFIENLSYGGGGAIVFQDSGQVNMQHCDFHYNWAGGSGGCIAFLEGMVADLEYINFDSCHAESDFYLANGGAVFISPYGNEVSLSNCYFGGNTAGDNGGALYTGSTTTIVGCQFDANATTSSDAGGGGAIAVLQTEVTLLNCTFSANVSPLESTTIYSEDAKIAMINSILWDDAAGGQAKIHLRDVETPSELFVDHTNLQGGMDYILAEGNSGVTWATGNLDVDPRFRHPVMDHQLSPDSPCIDAGRSDTLQFFLPSYDLEGNPRTFGGEIDMGAFEYQWPIRIPEAGALYDLSFYPNPARDHIYVHNGSGIMLEADMHVLNSMGQVIMSRKLSLPAKANQRISLSGLSPAMYSILILGGDIRFTSALIVH